MDLKNSQRQSTTLTDDNRFSAVGGLPCSSYKTEPPPESSDSIQTLILYVPWLDSIKVLEISERSSSTQSNHPLSFLNPQNHNARGLPYNCPPHLSRNRIPRI